MEIAGILKDLNLDEGEVPVYKYVDVFKNPSKMPINQIHLERTSFHLKHEIPKDIDLLEISAKDLKQKFYAAKKEVIPALDKGWLPKCILYQFEPYFFNLPKEENESFITKNTLFIEGLEYLLKCNFHQFWCTILFEPSATLALRSFVLNPVPPYEAKYLEDEYATMYKRIFHILPLVFERLITFKVSETEYMTDDYGFQILLENKLINLPIVNTLAWLFKTSHIHFVNKLTDVYFNDTSQLEFRMKEVEDIINLDLLIFDMVKGHLCGFDPNMVKVPIAIEPRPPVFNLPWVYSVVNYLLNTVSLLNTLLQFHKPAVEISLNKDLPYRIPSTYFNVYRELYELLDDREELKVQKSLADTIFDEINLGRMEMIELYHHFISYCVDKALEYMGDNRQQEHIVEIYLKLLVTGLEEEYFICDYDQRYNIASQNEMFENCAPLDNTRTQFVVSCINKLPRHRKLEQFSKLNRKTLEDVFKDFKPPETEEEFIPERNIEIENRNDKSPKETEIELMIKDIIDMFPHLGDGFVMKCLESYNYNSSDVINAILEENLPPHLYEIPFDSIRIPPEPEPEKPAVAYWGKKPEKHEDAMSLLNDKSELQQLKSFVLEGVQFNNDYLYDDEYDDRDDDDVPIKVADNPVEREIVTFNPNHEELASDTSYSSDEEYDESGKPIGSRAQAGAGTSTDPNKKKDFCVDPAILRAQREAKFRATRRPPPQPKAKANVVGKPKGQGQEKDVLKARDKKNTHKSSRANHSRKSGAAFKRTRGLIPS